jgi:hypothetical protein
MARLFEYEMFHAQVIAHASGHNTVEYAVLKWANERGRDGWEFVTFEWSVIRDFSNGHTITENVAKIDAFAKREVMDNE